MRRRALRALSLCVVVVIASSVAAHADQAQVDGDTATSGNNIAFTATGGGGAEPCANRPGPIAGRVTINYQGNTHFNPGATVTVTVTPNAAAAAAGITASGGTVVIDANPVAPGNEWDSTDDSVAVSISTTVPTTTPNGTYTVNVSASGPGTQFTGPTQTPVNPYTITTSYTVTVNCPAPADTTPPVITPTVTGTLGNNGWYTSDVAVSWTVADPESTVTSTTGCGTSNLTTDTAGQTFTCSATSTGGTSSQSVTIKRDATAPTISAALAPPSPAGSGWYNGTTGAPTVTFTCSDAMSGIAPDPDDCPDAVTLGEGADRSASGTVKDNAGNSATAGVTLVDVDTVAPTIVASLDRSPDVTTGWYNATTGAPKVSFSCGDATSGLAAACPASHTFGEGENQTYSQTISDLAGNSASAGVTDIDVDLTPPSVSSALDRAPAGTGWFNASTGAPTLEYTCTDALSGIADPPGCPADVPFGEGADQSVADVTVYDEAGNSATGGGITDVDVDTVAPTISSALDRAADSTGWFNLSTGAPVLEYTCDGGTSGLADPPGCPADVPFGEGADQSVADVTVYDEAGNSATGGGITDVDVDLTVPTISASVSPPPDAMTGWYNASTGAPTVSFSCSDALSGLAADPNDCPDSHLFGEGEDQSYSGTVYDVAGNSNTDGVTNIDVDLTAPTISAALDRAAAASGWFNEVTGAPTVEFTCSDALSGVKAPPGCPADFTFPNGENQSKSGTVHDVAGNSASAGVSDVDVDLTDPGITWSGSISDGDSFYFGFVPASPTCTATDALSGPNGCTVSGYSASVGSHTLQATAHDNAANEATDSRAYTVDAWTLRGFYQPVDMNGVYNVVRGGSTVPLKFEVFAGSTELRDVSVVQSFIQQKITCSGDPQYDPVEVTTTGGTSLRFDTTGDQFVQNWQTPKNQIGQCYRVTMTTDDGSAISAYFKLK